MAVIRDGTNPAQLLKVNPTYGAAHVTQFPLDALGRYRISEFTGLLTGVAANGEIFQARWTDAVNLALIKFLRISYSVITGFTAAQELAFNANLCAAWSADGSGGTSLTPGPTNMVKRSSYPQSKFGSMRIASTGALTAGTKTIYGNPIATAARKTMAAAATVQDSDFALEVNFDFEGGPLVLSQNEGLIVRNVIALGAAGTVRASITLGWEEITAADFPSL